MRALLTAIAFLALAAPAHAQDVLRVGLGDAIGHVLATPDGGAWTGAWVRGGAAVHRVEPDGTARVSSVSGLNGMALGPDGLPWVLTGGTIERVDAAGTVTTVSDTFVDALATGPDGLAWWHTAQHGLQRSTPDGRITSTPFKVPGCRGLRVDALARASDGAMWFLTSRCGMVRLPLGGTPVTIADVPSGRSGEERLVPDAAGGMWLSSIFESAGHIDARGRVTKLRGAGRTYDVALAPDGAAWFATGRCHIARANADGTITKTPTALPSWSIEFAPDGGLWLGSSARLQRTTIGAPAHGCDSTAPEIEITPKPAKRVRLAALRRHGGLKVTVREPVRLGIHLADAGEDPFSSRDTIVQPGTLRLPISPARLRRLARLSRPELELSWELRDAEGNYADSGASMRVVD
ncbi:hypothetical protein DVA67_005315 [Solirubrobacter sp. CPCC 204708]|uniref:Virginiamycin B lyase n=1 Tax=Solirubrobacter deserti TaxID=2282478 RepID=A0ABT4RGV0_9ACTN|nr:hypothetical protein [Solirubrobacter deserti]MBE2315384.1 hypothetical protein [Solirubrobacter deserti]MDA0137772.1 hypothetical protein [Solirubrobacter deserti]